MAQPPGQYSLQDALNRCLPVAKKVALGDLLNALITGVNGLASRMDAAGGATTDATVTATTGGTINAGDTYTLTVLNPNIAALVSPGLVLTSATISTNDTLATIANGLNALVNNNATLLAAGITSKVATSVVTVHQAGTIGNSTTITSALKAAASVTVTMANSGVLASGVGVLGTNNAAAFAGITPLASRWT